MQNVRIKELCGVMKGVDERIDVSILRSFVPIKRMGNTIIGQKMYVGKCMEIH